MHTYRTPAPITTLPGPHRGGRAPGHAGRIMFSSKENPASGHKPSLHRERHHDGEWLVAAVVVGGGGVPRRGQREKVTRWGVFFFFFADESVHRFSRDPRRWPPWEARDARGPRSRSLAGRPVFHIRTCAPVPFHTTSPPPPPPLHETSSRPARAGYRGIVVLAVLRDAALPSGRGIRGGERGGGTRVIRQREARRRCRVSRAPRGMCV
jgi:hypothetical protein